MEAFAEAFDIRRLHLASDPVRPWYLMNSLVCGGQPTKFMARCPLVASFPTEFASVKISDIRCLVIRHFVRSSEENCETE